MAKKPNQKLTGEERLTDLERRLADVEKRLTSFSMREMAMEVLSAAAAAAVFGMLPEAMQRDYFEGLRKNVSAQVKGRDGAKAERCTLEMENHAASLIDKMQVAAKHYSQAARATDGDD